jgi:DNA-binding CsgD family transcriptional regulator/tetratricopeptide (TPR) repeat protein
VRIEFTGTPTVGREPELHRLEAALETLAAGSQACVVIEGDPGIGKTRLLSELGARAEKAGALVLTGSATEFERELPFGPWVDALDAYVAAQELDLEDTWDAELALEIGEIIPSLRRPARRVRKSAPDERYRAHRAVRTLLELLARDRPLVLVLDDAHWADGASIELLGALLRREADAPLLFALAFRPGQAPVRLRAALAVPGVERIVLGQLSEREARALLGDLDPQSISAIYRHGGGNPFYLEQLARASRDKRSTTVLASGSGNGGLAVPGVPAAVAASFADELASLASRERTLLEAAAVAGEPFEPDLAAAIAELPVAEGLGALDALLALDLVRATHVPRRFVFRHPLLRHAVYEGAPAGWRLGAHARAARVLADRNASPLQRAHHVEQAASQGDEAAIAVLLAAGSEAAARAPAAAARWFEAALRLLPASGDPRHVDVRVSLASALRSVGELDRCREALLEAIDLLPPEAADRRVELIAWCAAVEHWLGRHGDAHRRLVRAWDDLPDQLAPAATTLQIELAIDGLYEFDFELTVEMGRRALAAAQAGGDRALIAAAASALCLGETAAGLIAAAEAHRDEARAEIDRLSDAELAPRLEALVYLGWAETYLERYDDAIGHAERGVRIARATGEGRLLVPLMLVPNFSLEMQGRLAEGIDCCEAALEVARVSANTHELYRALFELGWTRYYMGDLDGAIAAYEESAQLDERLAGGTIPNGGGGPGWGLGVARFESGQIERGRKILLDLCTDGTARTMPVERCFDWESLAIVELAIGNLDAASAHAARAEEDAAQLGLRLPLTMALRTRAEVLLAAGEPLEAARLAGESSAAALVVGARLQAAFSRGLEGRALVAAGERARAIPVLRMAEAELDACGSLRVRDQTRRELRRLGARAETRGPVAEGDSGIASLTRRELEIAALVTDRKTNREIAADLFLSDKTIESHIRNIFHKLGVSSRVDVARAVERDRREREPARLT